MDDKLRNRLYKPVLWTLTVLLLLVSSTTQTKLNQQRRDMGLTRLEPLENAPPALAFTTVALGGFRGLIANVLWIRAMKLQEDDKFFEMVQLSDWITKLQPHFNDVWIFQAWNMAYNVSVKLKDFEQRWRWVRRGIELLRDEGLKYNPDETMLFRELAWLYQHKMGQNMDDAHRFYKNAWASEMSEVLGDEAGDIDYESWLDPANTDAKARIKILKEKYKLDIDLMRQVDEAYGPLEWRLPEAHAIYWAFKGLQFAKREDLITLRRVIYQTMELAFERGRLVWNAAAKVYELGPNIEIIANSNRAFETQISEEDEQKVNIQRAHRNFLRMAVEQLFLHNRETAAKKWFDYMRETYPEAVNPPYLTLDQYVVERVTESVKDSAGDQIKSVIEGYIGRSYYNLAIGQYDLAEGYKVFAMKCWNRHQAKIQGMDSAQGRVGLPPFARIDQEVRDRLLDPEQTSLDPVSLQRLKSELGVIGLDLGSDLLKPGASTDGAAQSKPE
jgi:hypothetical protein